MKKILSLNKGNKNKKREKQRNKKRKKKKNHAQITIVEVYDHSDLTDIIVTALAVQKE